MMMRRYLFGQVCVLILINAPCVIYGNVAHGTIEVKTISTVECISNSDVKFQFVRETANKTRQTIAECETSLQTCYLANQSLGIYYAVFYTGQGAKLSVVNDVDETRGLYFCCETYDSTRCIQLKISLSDSTTNSGQENHTTTNNNPAIHIDITEIRIYGIIISLVLTIGLLVFLVDIFLRYRNRACSVCFRRKVVEQDLQLELLNIESIKGPWMQNSRVRTTSDTVVEYREVGK